MFQNNSVAVYIFCFWICSIVTLIPLVKNSLFCNNKCWQWSAYSWMWQIKYFLQICSHFLVTYMQSWLCNKYSPAENCSKEDFFLLMCTLFNSVRKFYTFTTVGAGDKYHEKWRLAASGTAIILTLGDDDSDVVKAMVIKMVLLLLLMMMVTLSMVNSLLKMVILSLLTVNLLLLMVMLMLILVN